ncbi:Uncharacterised protein [Vibrio cholerae]|nr:Uncharacterised protein [Vibrio cholerae]
MLCDQNWTSFVEARENASQFKQVATHDVRLTFTRDRLYRFFKLQQFGDQGFLFLFSNLDMAC